MIAKTLPMAKGKKSKAVKKDAVPDKDSQEKIWLEELKNSEAVQKYLEGFNSISSTHFMENYVRQKYYWHLNPELNARNNEAEQLKWIESAFGHLEMILQKKLFDAQCLWRAEKVKFKEISICEDFIVWENDVFNCPFIEPVNEDDIAMYSQYLQQNNADPDFCSYGEWQDYPEIKEAYETNNGNRDFPEWYDFHNGRTGAGALMTLPDIRGEKEKFYYEIHFANKQELEKEQIAEAERKYDSRPWLEYPDEDFIKWFVTTYENKQVQKVYEEYAWANRNADKKEDVMFEFNDLINADEPVPIEAHYDWYEGLKKTQNSYRCKKIAEALPMALEQYQMNIQMGIAFPAEKKSFHNQVREIWLGNILSGRKLNGEPEDLNF